MCYHLSIWSFKLFTPDDQLDYGTGRVAQISAVGIFVIPRKVLHDGFAIDQEFECLPIDGKVFILGHNACSAKTRSADFVANRAPPCTREKKEKKIIKEPNDQIFYLPARTGSARPPLTDW